MIDLEDLDSSLLKIDKKWYKKKSIYYIGYIAVKKIGDYKTVNSINPLYLIIHGLFGHIECNSTECSSTEEKNESKYLALSPDNELIDKYEEVWRGILMKLQQLMVIKNYGKYKRVWQRFLWKLSLTQMMTYH